MIRNKKTAYAETTNKSANERVDQHVKILLGMSRPNELPRMIRPMGTTQILSLRGLTRPGFLVQVFAGDSPTGRRS